jgi:DNA-binding Lrp family transcriptional regulator
MPVKISELDSEILRNLLIDGRKGYDEIAEECGVSKNKIWKRLKSMEKRGIVAGATAQVNFVHFGYDALATLLISVEEHQIDHIMEMIQKITLVRAYRQYNSVFNIRAIATLRNLSELNQIKEVLRRSLPTMVLKTYIWMGVRNIPENMNLSNKLNKTQGCNNPIERRVIHSNNAIALDELDYKIINKLATNGRAPFSCLAKEIGVSTDTVIKRYKRLKENGTIKVSIQINLRKIGYAAMVDFNIAFASPRGLSDLVIESLAAIPDVIVMTKISGDYDLQLVTVVRNMEQSFSLQDEISRICGTTKVEASARRIPERWPAQQQYMSTF